MMNISLVWKLSARKRKICFFSLFLWSNVLKGFVLMFSDDIFKQPRKNIFELFQYFINFILASKVCTIFKVPTKNFTTHPIKCRNAKFFTDSKFWKASRFETFHSRGSISLIDEASRLFDFLKSSNDKSYVNVLWRLFKTCVLSIGNFKISFCTQTYSFKMLVCDP